MSPKEKAIELLEKFIYELDGSTNEVVKRIDAKQCALIVADEFLHAYERFPLHPQSVYWQQVKAAIEKL